MMNILISGSASGMGAAVREKFLSEGHRVFSIDMKDLPCQDRLIHYTASITDESALSVIYDNLDTEGTSFDAIIDLAGIHDMLSFVESEPDRFRKLLDVDLMGHVLFNKVFYPLLNKNGRFIIVTSEVAYLDPMPFNGGYSVVKTALDCYTQSLRQELNLLGQKVITIRPGAVNTQLCEASIIATKRLSDETVFFKKQASKFVRIARHFMGKPIDPGKIANLIYRAAISAHPKLIYSRNRNPGLMLMNLLPKRLQLRIIRMILN